MSEAWPAMRLPAEAPRPPPVAPGVTSTEVMPLARTTGMCSLEGLTAMRARSCGLKSPISPVSTVSRTLAISARPMGEPESIMPG